MTKKAQNNYYIVGKVMVETHVEFKAVSLETALEYARTLGVDDFVTMAGDHNDSSLEIKGVWAL